MFNKIIHAGNESATMLSDGSIQFTNRETGKILEFAEDENFPSGQLCSEWKMLNGFPLKIEMLTTASEKTSEPQDNKLNFDPQPPSCEA